MTYPEAPPGSALARFFESLEALDVEFAGYTREGGQFTCPVHDDENPSFDVTVGQNGKPVWNCKPCLLTYGNSKEFASALHAVGVDWSGFAISPDEVNWGSSPAPSYSKGATGGRGLGKLTSVYWYKHPDGKPNFKVGRYEFDGHKTFRVYRWDRSVGDYAPGYGDVVRTPFHFEDFADWSEDGQPVYLVEGEKAAEALLNYPKRSKHATTFAGGADGALPEDWVDWFRGFASVRVWPDADEVGVERAKRLCAALVEAGVNAEVWGVPAEHLKAKDDAYDVLAARLQSHIRALSPEDLDALAALHRHAVAALAERPSAPPISLTLADGTVLVSVGAPEAAGGVQRVVREPFSVVASQEPYPFVREYLDRHYTEDGVLTLRFGELKFWLWSGTHYVAVEPGEMQARISRELTGAQETTKEGPRPLNLKRSVKAELLSALQDVALVSAHSETGDLLPARGGVPFRNGWLDIESGTLVDHSPERNVRWCVPGDYTPDAGQPKAWLQFLDSIGFTSDTEEYRVLRQWFGYLLSGDTKQQKALMMVGPSRAGKGTILDVVEGMMGTGHVGLDLGAFATNFGLSPVIGKGVATIGDARFDIKTDKALIRRMLSLTGQDSISVDIKHKDPVSVKITARLMIATNEVPALIEASNAFSSRFIFLRFRESFLGREDVNLARRILRELPGIVRWSLDGLADLRKVGHFTEPSSSREMRTDMADIGNPIRLFIDSECELGDMNSWVSTDDLYMEYVRWAEPRNYFKSVPGVFARDLNAAYPDSQIRSYQKKINNRSYRGFLGVRLRP